MSRIAFHTFGCKLNFAETSAISRQFQSDEHRIVDFRDEADIYVIHSCMVTANAERKTLTAVKQAHHRNPASAIIVIGCMAELQKDKLLQLHGVTRVLGNNDKFRLADYINNNVKDETPSSEFHYYPSWSVHERSRSFLKIQDGCDYQCAYCTIPLARGRSRSGSIEEIVNAAKEITASGVKEIVLTGVNIGDFGKHQGESLFDLLRRLEDIDELKRLRISSIEPDLLDDDIIRMATGNNKLLPHFHIPLQSGSNTVLWRMKRRYKRELFAEKVHAISTFTPKACIATDIITGFPGETPDEFAEGCAFINALDISYMHVFTYSHRNNTTASQYSEAVPMAEKRRRSKILHEMSEEKKQAFYLSNAGRILNAFFESSEKGGYIFGFTDNYIRVRHPYADHLIDQIVQVKLGQILGTDHFDADIIPTHSK